jgi:predicted RND superfamily exporter protein
VAISLSALLVFPMYFLRSFAYAGIAVVALACFGALIFLPALLAVIGRRIDRWTLFRRKPKEMGEGAWHRIATFVMRRPWPVAISVVAILLLLGSPFLGAEFGLPDDRVLPESASSRQVQDQIRGNFSSQEAAALSVVAVEAGPAGPVRDADVDRYAAELSDELKGQPSEAPGLLKQLQEGLGNVHDAHVLAVWLGNQAARAEARGQSDLATEARAQEAWFLQLTRDHHRELRDLQPVALVNRALDAMGQARPAA